MRGHYGAPAAINWAEASIAAVAARPSWPSLSRLNLKIEVLGEMEALTEDCRFRVFVPQERQGAARPVPVSSCICFSFMSSTNSGMVHSLLGI